MICLGSLQVTTPGPAAAHEGFLKDLYQEASYVGTSFCTPNTTAPDASRPRSALQAKEDILMSRSTCSLLL